MQYTGVFARTIRNFDANSHQIQW